jgi:hypothetical protein
VQVPTEPCRAHEKQLPLHAESQHTPSTQLPETQSLPDEQARPFGICVEQAPNTHAKPLAQSPLTVQVVGQVMPAPLHTYGVQLGAPVAPWPSVVQVPSEATVLQVWQGALQALAQQMPSAVQMLEAHWLPAVQAPPFGCRGMHTLPTQ